MHGNLNGSLLSCTRLFAFIRGQFFRPQTFRSRFRVLEPAIFRKRPKPDETTKNLARSSQNWCSRGGCGSWRWYVNWAVDRATGFRFLSRGATTRRRRSQMIRQAPALWTPKNPLPVFLATSSHLCTNPRHTITRPCSSRIRCRTVQFCTKAACSSSSLADRPRRCGCCCTIGWTIGNRPK